MNISRRKFLAKSAGFICLSSMLGLSNILQAREGNTHEFQIFSTSYQPNPILFSKQSPVVSITRVNNKWSESKGIEHAVTKAIDLIGGIQEVATGKSRILLKPNLVNPTSSDTTNPRVIEALARLMKNAGKEVSVGEAGAASSRNIKTSIRGFVCRTKNTDTLVGIQDDIFKATGYDELSKRVGIPLVNLHVGDMVKMTIPDNFVFKDIYYHKAIADADLVCSVPMMKTHGLATVTLALKNIGIGAFPGMMYGTVRSKVHQEGLKLEPTGTSAVVVDMVKANKLGLCVIDATTAMEGQGPSARGGGNLVEMNLIIASTNALAADLVAASIMGFEPPEIDTFNWAWKAGMNPSTMNDIEIVGEKIETVRHKFKRPRVIPYRFLANWYGPSCD
jgi:uncharacterized protein (DUF362 family)